MSYINILVQIKNAEMARKKSIKIPLTKTGKAFCAVLKEYGFIKDFEIKGKSPKRFMDIDLLGKKQLRGMKLLSTPSLRRYGGYNDFKKVKSGYGVLIVSTSKGIMSGYAARREKVGGQLLCEIW